MKAPSEITLGDIGRGVGRYWPILGPALVMTLIVTVLPARHEGNVETVGGGALASSAPVESVGAAAPAGSGGQLASPAAAGTYTAPSAPAAPNTGGAVPAGRAAPATPGPAAPTGAAAAPAAQSPAGTFPGVGTPAALSAPDCDRAKGQLMLPTVYAPPCVPLWPKGADNGGATSPGVTADAITVVVKLPVDDPTYSAAFRALGYWTDIAEAKRTVAAWLDLWNKHAELYGRTVKYTFFQGSGNDAEAERADAIKVAKEIHPFAVLCISPAGPIFCPEMAARGSYALAWPPTPEKLLNARAPYLYAAQSAPSLEQGYVGLGQWAGSRLVGGKAAYAGDLLMQAQVRKLALVYDDLPETRAAAKLLDDEFARVSGGTHLNMIGMSGDVTQSEEQARLVVAKLKQAKITTVIASASFISMVSVTKEATKETYRPEWVGGDPGYNNNNITLRLWDPVQSAHLFGTTGVGAIGVPDGQDELSRLYEWEYGPGTRSQTQNPAGTTMLFYTRALYTGLQLAGPRLTPLTFRDGLFSAPPRGGAVQNMVTNYTVSFGRHGFWSGVDWASIDDVAQYWWSPADQSHGTAGDNGKSLPGTMMYPDGGKRVRVGGIPRGEPSNLFNRSASASALNAAPAAETPTYPNKKVRGQ